MTGISLTFLSGRVLDEDWVDILNRFWTVFLLVTCSVGAFTARYVTTPISCFTPQHISDIQAQYVTQKCFLNEAFVHKIESATHYSTKKHATVYDISWHLWIPLILFLQAVCFKAPNVIWNLFKQPVMININDTISALEGVQITQPEKRHVLFRDAALVLSSFLQGNRFMLGSLYLAVKLLFCLNVIGQFIFITIFFRHELGIRVGESVLNPNYTQVPVFPTNIVCYLDVTLVTNTQIFIVQCQLPINEIFTKCYVFLWYWVFFVTVITSINLVMWIGFLFIPFMREPRISSYVRAFNVKPGASEDKRMTSQFVSNFLGVDGVFMLTMIGRNASELVAAHLANHLFLIFKEIRMPGTGGVYGQPSQQGSGQTVHPPGNALLPGQAAAYDQPLFGQASAPPVEQRSVLSSTDIPPAYSR